MTKEVCDHCYVETTMTFEDRHGNRYCCRSCFMKHTHQIKRELAEDASFQGQCEREVGIPGWQQVNFLR